jgi:hypothetical protein
MRHIKYSISQLYLGRLSNSLPVLVVFTFADNFYTCQSIGTERMTVEKFSRSIACTTKVTCTVRKSNRSTQFTVHRSTYWTDGFRKWNVLVLAINDTSWIMYMNLQWSSNSKVLTLINSSSSYCSYWLYTYKENKTLFTFKECYISCPSFNKMF